MKFLFKENDCGNHSTTPTILMIDMERNTLYKTSIGEFCIRLNDDELLFINYRGFMYKTKIMECRYCLMYDKVTKLHNAKLTLEYCE